MMRNTKLKVLMSLSVIACVGIGTGVIFWQEPSISVVQAETLADFRMEEGASIRKTSPVGIRFSVTVDENTAQKAEELQNVQYGSILIPSDLLGEEELTLETKDVLRIETELWATEAQDLYYSVLVGGEENGAFTDIPESFYNKPISARGYLTGIKDGQTIVYYTSNVIERSIGYTAVMAEAAGDTSPLVSEIAEKTEWFIDMPETVELTLSDAGNSDLLENTYKKSADVAKLVIGGVVCDAEITYTLDTPGIAEVGEDGKITAVKEGTTVLTASYEMGGETKTAECTLTVGNKEELISPYTILLPENTSDTLDFAAEEFVRLFGESTGVQLPVKTETGTEVATGKYISLGNTKMSRNASVAATVSGATSASVKTVGDDMYIVGETDRGVLNGIYRLFGDMVGYEYYMSDVYALEKATALDLPANVDYRPDIEFNVASDGIAGDTEELLRGGFVHWTEGLIPFDGELLHTSLSILSPEVYQAAHPSWYAGNKQIGSTADKTDANGVPVQLCYNARGNESERAAMVSETARIFKEALDKNPNLTKICFGLQDNDEWCECEECAKSNALAQLEYYYDPSGDALAFINDVCEELETQIGDREVHIIFLAYHKTNQPPADTMQLHKYIDIMFAESMGDYVSDLNGAANAEIKANLDGWEPYIGADNHLFVWTYNAMMEDFFLPYDSFDSMRANYGILKEAGAQSVYNFTDSARTGWTDLKRYLSSKLAWNAEPLDEEWEAWLDGYFVNAYGAGGTAMRAWFDDYLAYAQTIKENFAKEASVYTENPLQ